ncbi:MAG: GntR family transcriptional regulator [Myxococcota bacterium]
MQQLRDEIVLGKMLEGTLLRDAELAARLGVSITPVREAMVQLTADGLVETRPNHPRRVAAMSPEAALEIVDVAGVLAAAGFEWALDQLSDDDRATLRQQFDALEVACDQRDLLAVSAVSLDFTLTVVQAAHNGELVRQLRNLSLRFRRVLLKFADEAQLDFLRESCRDILLGIEAGRHDTVVQLVRQLYRDYRAMVEARVRMSASDQA